MPLGSGSVALRLSAGTDTTRPRRKACKAVPLPFRLRREVSSVADLRFRAWLAALAREASAMSAPVRRGPRNLESSTLLFLPDGSAETLRQATLQGCAGIRYTGQIT